MRRVLTQWQSRMDRAETRLADVFHFRNKKPAVVVVDANYWTQDDPDRMHKLMQMTTDALIAWVKFQKQRTGQRH